MSKNSSICMKPANHKCVLSRACKIQLFDIGKTFHSFPAGIFRAIFVLPSLPKSVLDRYITNPWTWNWEIKAGPQKGTLVAIPTIPTISNKTDDTATKFAADLFFSFKNTLSPHALKKGRVPDYLVRLYQNNMLLHFKTEASKFVALSQAKRAKLTPDTAPELKNKSFAQQLSTSVAAPAPTLSTENNDHTQTILALQEQIVALTQELSQLRAVFATATSLPNISPPFVAAVSLHFGDIEHKIKCVDCEREFPSPQFASGATSRKWVKCAWKNGAVPYITTIRDDSVLCSYFNFRSNQTPSDLAIWTE